MMKYSRIEIQLISSLRSFKTPDTITPHNMQWYQQKSDTNRMIYNLCGYTLYIYIPVYILHKPTHSIFVQYYIPTGI